MCAGERLICINVSGEAPESYSYTESGPELRISYLAALSEAQEVWRVDAVGDKTAKAAEGGERSAEESDLSLDKAMLQISQKKAMKPARARQLFAYQMDRLPDQHPTFLWRR